MEFLFECTKEAGGVGAGALERVKFGNEKKEMRKVERERERWCVIMRETAPFNADMFVLTVIVNEE